MLAQGGNEVTPRATAPPDCLPAQPSRIDETSRTQTHHIGIKLGDDPEQIIVALDVGMALEEGKKTWITP